MVKPWLNPHESPATAPLDRTEDRRVVGARSLADAPGARRWCDGGWRPSAWRRNRCYFTIIWCVLYKNRMCTLIEHILKIIHLHIFHIYIYIYVLYFFSYCIICIIYYDIICHMCSIFSFLTYLPWGKRSHVENPWGNHRNIIYIHGG